MSEVRSLAVYRFVALDDLAALRERPYEHGSNFPETPARHQRALELSQ